VGVQLKIIFLLAKQKILELPFLPILQLLPVLTPFPTKQQILIRENMPAIQQLTKL
jgi:hypothetical protein